MPWHHLVLTCGTSAKANAAFQPLWPTSLATLDLAQARALGASTPLPPRPDPRRVSAEYSALHALRALGELSGRLRICLLHTETPEGVLAAWWVRRALEVDFEATVELRSVGDLDAGRREAMREGLGQYLKVVAAALREGTPHGTAFVPLGGYKVMTGLAYLMASYLGYPLLYLHEGDQVLHRLPVVPLHLDAAALRAAAPLVRRLHAGRSLHELSPEHVVLLEAQGWLFERARVDGEEILSTNAFAEFLREEPAWRGTLGTRVMWGDAPPRDLRFVARQVESLLEHRTDRARVGEVHHEQSCGLGGQRYALFKGASGPAGVFRAAWSYDETEDTLYIAHAWFDHQAYERALTRPRLLDAQVAAWTDLTAALFPAD